MLSPDRPITSKEIPMAAAAILERIRVRTPRIHCITNAVAQNFSANMLLAVGAIPSMTIAPEEVGQFALSADALLVNLGPFDAERRKAADIAIDVMVKQNKPWLLDPVFVERSPPRTAYAQLLLEKHPRAVRLNRAEFTALAGTDVEGATLSRFSALHNTIVGLTGEADIVMDYGRLVCITNGDPLMVRVTAMGCAGSCIIGACLAVEKDAWVATAAGLLILGVAGQLAAKQSQGPGSLAVNILDVLHNLDGTALIEHARVV